MEFKSSELNGILLSIAEAPMGSPSLSIEVYNGKVSKNRLKFNHSLKLFFFYKVVMSCDLGNGETFRAETKFSSKFSLCDNKWHFISALYDTHQVAIRIDDQPFVVAYAPSRSIGKLQTKSALYIGGLPGKEPENSLCSSIQLQPLFVSTNLFSWARFVRWCDVYCF